MDRRGSGRQLTSSAAVVAYVGALLAISFAGSLLPLVRAWSRQMLCLVVSFCAGILLGATFFHMVPEAAEHTPHFGAAVLGGFLMLYVLERFILSHTCEEQGCDYHRLGASAFVGIVFHDLVEGFSLGASLSAPGVSLPVFAAIAIHKIPSTFSLTGVLLLGRYSRTRITVLSFVLACMTPIGVLVSFFVLKSLAPGAIALSLAVAAGTLLAIATSDLLPHVHGQHEGRLKNLGMLLAGVALMALGGEIGGH